MKIQIKLRFLKAGYEYNTKVPKINMNITNQEQNWYFAYCYKMILAEKSLKGIQSTRS